LIENADQKKSQLVELLAATTETKPMERDVLSLIDAHESGRERIWHCVAGGRRLDAAMASEKERRSPVLQVYVYPPRLCGSVCKSDSPLATATLTNTPRPRLNPEGDEAALDVSDDNDILPPTAKAIGR